MLTDMSACIHLEHMNKQLMMAKQHKIIILAKLQEDILFNKLMNIPLYFINIKLCNECIHYKLKLNSKFLTMKLYCPIYNNAQYLILSYPNIIHPYTFSSSLDEAYLESSKVSNKML